MPVYIRFLPDDITVTAEPGEPFLEVAQRGGITIPTGCLMGSCYACAAELENGETICTCISAVPLGPTHLTLNLYSDPSW